MIEEDDEHFDPLLDDVDMVTFIEEDVDSESVTKRVGRHTSRCTGSLLENEGNMATRERPKTPGGSAKQWIFAPRRNRFYNNCLRVHLLQ